MWTTREEGHLSQVLVFQAREGNVQECSEKGKSDAVDMAARCGARCSDEIEISFDFARRLVLKNRDGIHPTAS